MLSVTNLFGRQLTAHFWGPGGQMEVDQLHSATVTERLCCLGPQCAIITLVLKYLIYHFVFFSYFFKKYILATIKQQKMEKDHEYSSKDEVLEISYIFFYQRSVTISDCCSLLRTRHTTRHSRTRPAYGRSGWLTLMSI